MHPCCALDNDAVALAAALQCLLGDTPQPACVHEASSADKARVLLLRCAEVVVFRRNNTEEEVVSTLEEILQVR